MSAGDVPFYSQPGLHVEIYDSQTLAEWDESQNDIPFYLEEAKAAGGPILELGCGTGQARWTFRYEMRYLVENCGFKVEAEYSDFQRSPPAYGKEQIWVLQHR